MLRSPANDNYFINYLFLKAYFVGGEFEFLNKVDLVYLQHFWKQYLQGPPMKKLENTSLTKIKSPSSYFNSLWESTILEDKVSKEDFVSQEALFPLLW